MPSTIPKNEWGPAAWITLHSFAAAYDPSQRDVFVDFLTTFGKLLPCEYCRKNFAKKLIEAPPEEYLDSTERALWYTYMLHDMANRDITVKYHHAMKHGLPFDNTPKRSPDWTQVRRMYLGY